MKNSTLVGLAIALTSTLAGCELYFGHNGNDHWNYCASDGYYDCVGDNCTWVADTCPANGSGSGSGYTCTTSNDCAQGCYCANGTCTEAGFCSTNADCPTGYHCNTDRSSCEADPPAPTCSADADCASGQVCTNGACSATCSCTSDAQAVNAGYGWCDETRNTCMTGTDPAGSCAGTITCATKEPTCPAGSTGLIVNGCWTGECRAIAQCSEAPACGSLEHEQDCLDRTTDCSSVYLGLNCHTPTGGACHAGDTNCTCANFQFDRCTDKIVGLTSAIQTSTGTFVDVSTMQ